MDLLGEPLNYGYEVEDPFQPLNPRVEDYVIDLLKSLETKRLQPLAKRAPLMLCPSLFIVIELVVV